MSIQIFRIEIGQRFEIPQKQSSKTKHSFKTGNEESLFVL